MKDCKTMERNKTLRAAWIDIIFGSVIVLLLLADLVQIALMYENIRAIPVYYNVWTGLTVMSGRIEDFVIFGLCMIVALIFFGMIVVTNVSKIHKATKIKETL